MVVREYPQKDNPSQDCGSTVDQKQKLAVPMLATSLRSFSYTSKNQ